MTTFEKAKWLTDKQHGPGISVATLARYCGYHYTSLSHYLNGTRTSDPTKLEHALELAMPQLVRDLCKILEE